MFSQKTLVRCLIDGGILATICIVIGSLWDTVIHIRSGHTLLAPAHLLIIASALFFSLGGGVAYVVLRREVSVLRMYVKTVMWGGGILFVAILIIDEAWHLLFGLDTSGWSPPHLIFWAGAIVELFGLIMLEGWLAGERRADAPGTLRVRQLCIAASMLIILLFLFLEFDVPNSHIGVRIPAFTYAVTAACFFAYGVLAVSRALGTAGAVTAAAFLAWSFFWGTGWALESVYGISFMRSPFPIFIPALVLDLWQWSSSNHKAPWSLAEYIARSCVLSTVCYWSVVVWAILVTKLPQQLSGRFGDWMIWFTLFVPLVSLVAGYLAWRTSGYVSRLERALENERVTARLKGSPGIPAGCAGAR